MKTLPQPTPAVNPKTPRACIEQVEAGRLAAEDEVERLEAMSDNELAAERLDLIEQTATTQALSAMIVDIQKRRNIDRSLGESAEKVRRIREILSDVSQDEPLVKKLWLAIRGIE